MAKLFLKTSFATYLILVIVLVLFNFSNSSNEGVFEIIQTSVIGVPFIFVLGASFFIPAIMQIFKDIFLSTPTEQSSFIQAIPGGPFTVSFLLLFLVTISVYGLIYVKNNTHSIKSYIALIIIEIIWFFIFVLSLPVMGVTA